MRVFVILLLLLPLLCPAMTQAQSASAPQADSLSRYIHQQLDSIKLELQKAESETLASEARELRSDVSCMMEWIVGLIAVLVGLIAIILAIAGFYWFRTQRQVREARDEAVKSACDEVKRDLKPQIEAVLKQIQEDARKAIDEKTKDFDLPQIGQPVSEDDLKRLREVDERLKRLEETGGRLSSKDHVLRARKLVEDRLLDLALNAYNDAITEDKTNNEAWFGRGYCLGEMKRHPESEVAFREAIRLKLDDAQAYNNLGCALAEQGKHTEAEASFREAIARDKDSKMAWFNLARVCAVGKDKMGLLAALKRAIELDQEWKVPARTYQDFKDYWEDDDFKKIVGE
ncbi:MAG: tetratricopeptide repeat protein [bacterium]|nr:tetratricopeptide repeat protein [bacterium]